MNEDESTQTLSDKVIDRANTLRFTRPSRFPEATPGAEGRPAGGYLTIAQWKCWHRDAGSLVGQDRSWLEERIQRLNAALDDLGRPFGHRVEQAIRLYCANHPGAVSRRRPLGHALVDQLELRIFPKLRGVICDEHGDALDRLRDLLLEPELRDDAVLDAFDRARQQDLFQWPGVARGEDT